MTILSSKRGFTLIELLVVIAIIGLLASIISVSLITARAKGRDAKRISDIRTLQLALETYYNDNAKYPLTLSTLSPTYLATIPTDPVSPSTQYSYYAVTTGGGSNCGLASNPPVGYHLGAVLEDKTNPALIQDADSATVPSGYTTACSGGSSAGFVGTSAGSSYQCNTTAGTAQTGGGNGTELCYDVVPGS